jgi:hypothetical protein
MKLGLFTNPSNPNYAFASFPSNHHGWQDEVSKQEMALFLLSNPAENAVQQEKGHFWKDTCSGG